VIRKRRPGRQLKLAPRASHAEASCPQRKLPLVGQPPVRRQLYGQKEEAVRKDKAAQPRHGARVPVSGTPLSPSKPQTENRGLHYTRLPVDVGRQIVKMVRTVVVMLSPHRFSLARVGAVATT
jgi:hypothetical protein